MLNDNKKTTSGMILSRPLMSSCIKLAVSPRAFPIASALEEDSPATIEEKADMRFCCTSH